MITQRTLFWVNYALIVLSVAVAVLNLTWGVPALAAANVCAVGLCLAACIRTWDAR